MEDKTCKLNRVSFVTSSFGEVNVEFGVFRDFVTLYR